MKKENDTCAWTPNNFFLKSFWLQTLCNLRLWILCLFWCLLGRSCAHFGTSWGDLGVILEPLGGVLAASCGHLEQLLEPTSQHLGNQLGYKHFVTCFLGSCVYLGGSWGDLGCILGPLGAILGSSWNLLGVSWQRLGGILNSSWNPLHNILATSLVTNTL